MELRCIHTADVHIGLEFNNASFGSEYGKKRRKEIFNTFLRIIDRAKEISAHFLFISGDLYEDEFCSIGDIRIISNKLSELNETKVIIISGNHDYLHNKSLYNLVSWSPNIYIIDSSAVTNIEFEDLNTVIYGLSWYKKEEKDNLLDTIQDLNNKKINILLAHGDIFNKNSDYLPIDKENLIKKEFDYVGLGHIHKHEFITEKIAYPGSPEPLDFGETGEHGIIEGSISKEINNMNFNSFSSRKFIIEEVEVTPEMSYLEIIDNIKKCDTYENRNKNLYRIKLNGVRDIHMDLDTNEIVEELKCDFNYIEIIDNTYKDYDLEKLYKENKDNIIGMFINNMKEKGLDDNINKNALYYGLDVLLDEKVRL